MGNMTMLTTMASLKAMTSIHPLAMSLSILIISIMTAMLIFKKTMLSWMAFVFILTFASGMMTLFIYVTSLTPNEKMKSKKSMKVLFILMIITTYPISTSETMKNSMKSFSSQITMLMMGLVILLTMVAIAMQGYNPNQAASTNF